MSRLNQVVAAEKSVKSAVLRDVTDVYQQLQKSALLTGITKTYRPKADDGETVPPEIKKVQITVNDALNTISTRLTELFDITATKEKANCLAMADIIIDGVTILEKVPVTYLLFLEKQLADVYTIVRKLPILDPAESWTMDSNRGYWVTTPKETSRTTKVHINHVKADATDKHPAQVEVFSEDQVVGYYSTIWLSGALPASRVAELTKKVEALVLAVKSAREEANSIDAPPVKVGKEVFDYLFS